MRNTLTRSARVFLGVNKDHDRSSFFIQDDDSYEMDSEASEQEDLPLWMTDQFWDVDVDSVPVPLEDLDYHYNDTILQYAEIDMLDGQAPVWQGRARSRCIGQGKGSIMGSTRPEVLAALKMGKKTGDFNEFDRVNAKSKIRQKKVHGPYFIISQTIIDVLLMAWAIWVNGGLESFDTNPMLGVSGETLIEIGGKWVPFITGKGEWWRWFVPIFLHGGIIHLVLNALMQLYLGIGLEKQHGTLRILPIYIISGLFGNVLSGIFLPGTVSVGASGSIFAFFGITLVDLFRNWNKVDNPCSKLVSFSISMAVSLILGILPIIDNFIHVGGFLMGIISGIVFLPTFHVGKIELKKRFMQVCIAAPIMIALNIAVLIIFYSNLPTDWCPFCQAINCVEIFDFTCT
eukprot:TRINITY_DN11064_c0_g1_i1.p1 TRINITY_DN11064_c0_g1~~TRINITY_DN11064_c0_g1_i1.p1  ORF type:complete len:401 (+),score=68.87 TRINITY_DN11064_c0_g1_i1:46-1248(+)